MNKPSTRDADSDLALWAFFVGACAVTWACAAPMTVAVLRHEAPSEGAMSLAGLSAFGPTIAAVAVTAKWGRVRRIFGPWRTPLLWLVLALAIPIGINLLAKLIALGFGGAPPQWFYPPFRPEHWAALVVFPIGEEIGWRGYAQPRMVRRFGAVRGSALVGLGWLVWHAMYVVSPDTGELMWETSIVLLYLPPMSIVVGWALHKTGGSLAVAILFHAAAHLDNPNHMPTDLVGVRVVLVVLAFIAAWLAARALRRDGA